MTSKNDFKNIWVLELFLLALTAAWHCYLSKYLVLYHMHCWSFSSQIVLSMLPLICPFQPDPHWILICGHLGSCLTASFQSMLQYWPHPCGLYPNQFGLVLKESQNPPCKGITQFSVSRYWKQNSWSPGPVIGSLGVSRMQTMKRILNNL